MTDWGQEIDAVRGPDFAGVVSIGTAATADFERAYGRADRAHGAAVEPDTRFAIASGTKLLTALVVVSLVVDGTITLDTRARSLLGPDLPLVADDVTVEHLLGHTSGIGDYVDEEGEEVRLKVAVQDLVNTEDYLPALDGFATKFTAGTGFAYCNSGFVVLALIAERASGRAFHDLVSERVLVPAGMSRTAFLRSDELPGDAAIGYLPDGRTNVFAVPVRGNGDGGVFTTVADVRRLWTALFDGRIVPAEWVRRMSTPRAGGPPGHRFHYGLGLWLAGGGAAVVLDGGDHGASFRSVYTPATTRLWTVVSNTLDGITPIARLLHERLDG